MDDGSPIGLLVLFFLCLVGSFYFSGTEMAFASVNRIRMRGYAESGDARAMRVMAVLDNFDSALTTMLIGNNIVNISAATIATMLATRLWGAGSVTAVTLVVTLIVFLFAETLPKTFAKACNERFAMAVAGSLLGLMKLLRPLVLVFGKVTTFVSKPFRKGGKQPTVTEEELRDLIEDAVEDGALNEETGELVQSAIRYTDATVQDILTPWDKVRKVPVDTPPEALLEIIQASRHSRLPIVDAGGEPIGLLRIRKYLKAKLRGRLPQSLTEITDPAHSVPATTPVDDLLPVLSSHKTHFVLVRDDAGKVLGIVTMEDMLERLVGDIYDEEDELPGVLVDVKGGASSAR